MEDRFNLVEVTMNPMHGVVLADVFAEIQETLRRDLKAEFFEDFATHGIAQCLSVVLTATRKDQELPLLSADADRKDIPSTEDDGTSRRPDPGGNTTGLATRSGHEATLPRAAGQ
jgi:hypothetical protein